MIEEISRHLEEELVRELRVRRSRIWVSRRIFDGIKN